MLVLREHARLALDEPQGGLWLVVGAGGEQGSVVPHCKLLDVRPTIEKFLNCGDVAVLHRLDEGRRSLRPRGPLLRPAAAVASGDRRAGNSPVGAGNSPRTSAVLGR